MQLFFCCKLITEDGALAIAALRIGKKNSSQSGRVDPYPSRRRLAKATIAGPPWVKMIFLLEVTAP